MNLSRYEPLDPDLDGGDRQERREACGETLPTDDQRAILPLTPGKRPLRLAARDSRFAGPPPRLAALPHPLGDLGAAPTAAAALAQGLGVIAVIRCPSLHPLTWSAACAGSDVASIQPREDLGALIPRGWGRARGPRHARRVREAVDQQPVALPALGHALTAARARGNTSRPRPHAATESSHVPRPAPAGGLASRPASRPPASVAARDGPHAWPPMGGRAGDHTSDPR